MWFSKSFLTPARLSGSIADSGRAFAAENAESLTAIELQAMMRHRSFTSTQRSINMSRLDSSKGTQPRRPSDLNLSEIIRWTTAEWRNWQTHGT